MRRAANHSMLWWCCIWCTMMRTVSICLWHDVLDAKSLCSNVELAQGCSPRNALESEAHFLVHS